MVTDKNQIPSNNSTSGGHTRQDNISLEFFEMFSTRRASFYFDWSELHLTASNDQNQRLEIFFFQDFPDQTRRKSSPSLYLRNKIKELDKMSGRGPKVHPLFLRDLNQCSIRDTVSLLFSSVSFDFTNQYVKKYYKSQCIFHLHCAISKSLLKSCFQCTLHC